MNSEKTTAKQLSWPGKEDIRQAFQAEGTARTRGMEATDWLVGGAGPPVGCSCWTQIELCQELDFHPENIMKYLKVLTCLSKNIGLVCRGWTRDKEVMGRTVRSLSE